MNTETDKNVHQLFASFFDAGELTPFITILSKAMEDGHICVSTQGDMLAEWMNDDSEMQLSVLNPKILDKHPLVTCDPQINKQPFVWINDKLYTYRYWQYEQQILLKILDLKNTALSVRAHRIKEITSNNSIIRTLQGDYSIIPSNQTLNTDWQFIAAIKGYLNNLSIITGGPGTGKTTTISKLLEIILLLEPDSQIILAAPTGKASARMKESLHAIYEGNDSDVGRKIRSLSAQTIHQLLGSIRNSIYFKHDEKNPLPHDVVIIDEASMIDAGLMAKLLRSIRSSSRIIFLGDKNQLASVESGSIFGDLCLSVQPINRFSSDIFEQINSLIDNDDRRISPTCISKDHSALSEMTTELMRSFRFSDDGQIGRWAKAILEQNIQPLLSKDTITHAEINSFFDQAEAVLHDPFHSDHLLSQFCHLFISYIEEKDTLKALERMNVARILCATKMGPNGTSSMNRYVEQWLSQQGLIQMDHPFYENRPIMVRKNNKILGLSNGDIVLIRTNDNGNRLAYFMDENGQLKSIQPAYLSDAQTVFAMTIHKSQGSEYTNILTCLPKEGSIKLLTRELLYTAITRAKKRVIIQASSEHLIKCCSQEVRRASGIIDSLKAIDHGS